MALPALVPVEPATPVPPALLMACISDWNRELKDDPLARGLPAPVMTLGVVLDVAGAGVGAGAGAGGVLGVADEAPVEVADVADELGSKPPSIEASAAPIICSSCCISTANRASDA